MLNVDEPYWLTRREVDAIHVEMIREHGGSHGIRDAALIDSALGRPRKKWVYGVRDMAELGAAYAFGLVKNHGYVDGNKRVGFMATYVFLDMHGLELVVAEPDAVAAFEALARGDLTEEEMAEWLRLGTTRAGDS